MERYAAYDPLARVYDARWRFFIPRGLLVLDRLVLGDLGPALENVCRAPGRADASSSTSYIRPALGQDAIL